MKLLLLLPFLVVVFERLFRELVLREPTYYDWLYHALVSHEPQGTLFRVVEGPLRETEGWKFLLPGGGFRPGMVWLVVEDVDGHVSFHCVRRSYLQPIGNVMPPPEEGAS